LTLNTQTQESFHLRTAVLYQRHYLQKAYSATYYKMPPPQCQKTAVSWDFIGQFMQNPAESASYWANP
jgi:hypothetical protein